MSLLFVSSFGNRALEGGGLALAATRNQKRNTQTTKTYYYRMHIQLLFPTLCIFFFSGAFEARHVTNKRAPVCMYMSNPRGADHVYVFTTVPPSLPPSLPPPLYLN
jgi:hypothetical protein